MALEKNGQLSQIGTEDVTVDRDMWLCIRRDLELLVLAMCVCYPWALQAEQSGHY